MKKYLSLFLTMMKIGLFTFGGGYAMIPQIKEIVVEKKKWISEDDMLEILAIAESTPGPIAINMATYIGYLKGKVLGSIAATIGVVLPSLIIIFIISLFFDAFIANKYVAYAFIGINCAVAFLITKAAIDMIIKMKKKVVPIIVLCVVTVLVTLFKVFSINFSSIYLIIIGGIIGIISSSIANRKDDSVC